mgnify:CR=1 FL=1
MILCWIAIFTHMCLFMLNFLDEVCNELLWTCYCNWLNSLTLFLSSFIHSWLIPMYVSRVCYVGCYRQSLISSEGSHDILRNDLQQCMVIINLSGYYSYWFVSLGWWEIAIILLYNTHLSLMSLYTHALKIVAYKACYHTLFVYISAWLPI